MTYLELGNVRDEVQGTSESLLQDERLRTWHLLRSASIAQ